ncbi:FxsA family protein [Alkalicoccus urumqiensis]|uniref:Membrane protein FxsA n=1 Tax=Alkalicoccus urumqiensis TaxID=1548213 RepID=A0A2P6MDH7_ALKUR|nr:FxsA family protein [Alkalicoccus urumqiensis]PRO64320.1 membrane protein FxsA [Alkalicoccus urumqiensis]
MKKLLLLLLIVVPSLEMAVILLSWNLIGLFPTILMVVLTGVLGAWLAKREGLQAVRRAQLRTSQGQVPGNEILDGICILIGGIVLLTPGFISDAFGFLLLIPATRELFKGMLQRMYERAVRSGNIQFVGRSAGGWQQR